MTTIAYRDGIIAYDSRCSCGGAIVSDSYNKKRVRDGVVFFFCGSIRDNDYAIDLYFNRDVSTASFVMFVVDDGEVSYFCANEEELPDHSPLDLFPYYAIGSGEDHAYTAMDLGCSAKKAVEMAKLRDLHTGGKVREFIVKKP